MNFKLQHEHQLAMDCAALEAFGRDQMARARQQLEEEAKRIDPTTGWRDQIAAARKRHPDPLRLREAYQTEVDRARRFTQEKRLAPLPDGKLEIVETPVFQRPMI